MEAQTGEAPSAGVTQDLAQAWVGRWAPPGALLGRTSGCALLTTEGVMSGAGSWGRHGGIWDNLRFGDSVIS